MFYPGLKAQILLQFTLLAMDKKKVLGILRYNYEII
jgi:hypothetical protein